MSPTSAEPLEPLEVESIGPSRGVAGSTFGILGGGFSPGATVTLGDVPAEFCPPRMRKVDIGLGLQF